MTEHANYRAISPPQDKAKSDYTYAERRAEIFDMIDRAGHYRNIQQSTRELGDRFEVSHTTIQNDIDAILEWKSQHLGDNIEGELETLKTKAVQDLIADGDVAEAYKIISKHLENLQSIGEVEREPDKHEVEGSGIVINYGDE